MDEINRVSTKATAAIAYNSRMAYLTPAGYVGVSPTKEVEKKATGPGSTIKHKNYRKQPCPNEKLLPPVELMTRDQALRFAYLQEHDPKGGIKAMSGLSPKVDPEEEKKREEILKRIREVRIHLVPLLVIYSYSSPDFSHIATLAAERNQGRDQKERRETEETEQGQANGEVRPVDVGDGYGPKQLTPYCSCPRFGILRRL